MNSLVSCVMFLLLVGVALSSPHHGYYGRRQSNQRTKHIILPANAKIYRIPLRQIKVTSYSPKVIRVQPKQYIPHVSRSARPREVPQAGHTPQREVGPLPEMPEALSKDEALAKKLEAGYQFGGVINRRLINSGPR